MLRYVSRETFRSLFSEKYQNNTILLLRANYPFCYVSRETITANTLYSLRTFAHSKGNFILPCLFAFPLSSPVYQFGKIRLFESFGFCTFARVVWSTRQNFSRFSHYGFCLFGVSCRVLSYTLRLFSVSLTCRLWH